MKIGSYRTTNYLLIAILVVAAILRFNHITQPLTDAFSWRQTSTAMMADNFYRRNWNILFPEISWNGPGPSYNGREFQTVSYIAALLYALVGQHDWIGRSVAVTFGLWGIFALYQLVRRVWDEDHAIVSAAVMALLPGSIFIERSFLPDPAMVALVTTSAWLLVAYCQTERLRYLILAGAIGMWGFLSKIPGLIVGLPMLYAMVTILGFKRILQPKKLATISIVAVLTLLPVIAYYLWARYLSLSYPPYHFAGSGNWVWDHGFMTWWKQGYFLGRLSERFNLWIWTPPVTALVFLGLLFPPPKGNHSQESASDKPSVSASRKAPWLFHWWFFGALLYYFIGARELIDNPWNFHLVNPAAAALTGHAIVVIASFTTRIAKSSVSMVITAVLLLMLIGTFGQKNLKYMYQPYAHESHQMGLALRQAAQPGELVVTMANALGDPVAIYYSQRRGWVFPPPWPGVEWGNQTLEDDNEAIRLFEELRNQGADWLGIVDSQKKELWENNPKFVKYIERTCELKKESPDWVIYRILPQKKLQSFLIKEEEASFKSPGVKREN